MFTKDDLINLPRYSMYLKMMIDGVASKSFSALIIPANYKPIHLRKKPLHFLERIMAEKGHRLRKVYLKDTHNLLRKIKSRSNLIDFKVCIAAKIVSVVILLLPL